MAKTLNYKYKTLGIMLVFLSILLFSISTPTHADNDPVTDEVAITVPVSCLLSGTNLQHTANMHNDEFMDDIGSATITAHCNDTSGFAIYAIGYTNDEEGNNYLIDSNLDSSFNIPTGKYTAGTTTNSVWSMKLTPVTGPYAPTIRNDATYNFTDYELVPTTHTKVASYPSGTDLGDGALGSNFTTDYAVYISNTQNAGTYTGQVKFTLVHPESAPAPLSPQTTETGKICYYANANDAIGTMGCQTIPASGTTDGVSPTSAVLLASNFSRDGYGFAGWSTTHNYATTGNNAHFYGPQEEITYTEGTYSGNNNGLSLYAYWVPSAGNLQSWSGCSSLANGAVTALTDLRDNDTYAVAKLADGNCWMIENLRLDNTAEHNTDGALAQGYNASFIGLADPEAPWADNSRTANSLYSTDGSTTKTISGNKQGYRFPRYNNVNTPATAADRPSNPTRNSATNSTSNAGMYSYGNYYTWAAAIADTTYYTSGDYDTTSICPTGWKISLGDISTGDIEQGSADTANRVGSFSWLDRKMGGTGAYQSTAEASLRWRKYPNNFVYSGLVSSGSVNFRGSLGHYWSSTAYSSGGAMLMYFTSSDYVYPGANGNSKDIGGSIRCLTPGA